MWQRTKLEKLAELHKSGIKDIREYLEEQAQKAREAELEAERQKQAEAEAERARLEAERQELDARKTVSDPRPLAKGETKQTQGWWKRGNTNFEKDVLPEVGHLYAASIGEDHVTQITEAAGVKAPRA